MSYGPGCVPPQAITQSPKYLNSAVFQSRLGLSPKRANTLTNLWTNLWNVNKLDEKQTRWIANESIYMELFEWESINFN